MAVIWMDGFNHYYDFEGEITPYIGEGVQYGWTALNGLDEEVYNYNRLIYEGVSTNARGWKMDDKNFDYGYKNLDSTESTIIVGWHAMMGSGWISYPILRFREAGVGTQITLDATSSRRLQVWRGDKDSGTIIGTGSVGTALPHHWVFIEIKVFFNSSTGYIIVRVDGEEVINETGINTVNTSNVWTDQIYFGYMGSMWVDNLYVTDGEVDTPKTDSDGFFGPIAIATLMPDGDNSPNNWTKSTGTTGWENVDDIGYTNTSLDTAYNYTSTSGNIESYTFDNLPTAGGTWTVMAVDSAVRTQRADSTDAESITITTGSQVDATNSVTEYNGAGNYWQYIKSIYDYSTGTTDWTETTVNALTVDVELD